jgi:beta-fructofuranosidase
MISNLRLDAGTRLDIWAKGPGFIRISIEGTVVWQVPALPAEPAHFRYHHRETCEIGVEWDNSAAVLWAYSYLPEAVSTRGITIWEFGDSVITIRTGAEIDAWMQSDANRPVMHFSPIRQWMNDPNGLCKVGDTWHLFYQFHPAGTDWGPMHWGHATSKDLFHWAHLPVFLSPDQNLWQMSATGGAFSGNAFHDRDGTIKFFYTERLPAYDLFKGYREIQKVAEPDRHLISAERISMVLEERPAGVEHDFRDPKVWWDVTALAYRMVLGASIDGDPSVLLYGSGDAEVWTYLGPLYRAPARFCEEGARAIECPDFFPLGGKWVLIMGFVGHTEPGTGRHNLLYALVGEFVNDRFLPDGENLQLLDFGTDYYAMQSFEADGRQIAFAWLFNWEYRKPPGSPYSGEMSLPRELSLTKDGRLAMMPVAEFDAACPAQRLTPKPDGNFTLPPESIDIQLDGNLEGTRIVARQDSALSFEITVSKGQVTIRLPQDDGSIRYQADCSNAKDLRIIHDRGILEVFTETGAVCGTRRSYQEILPDTLEIDTVADAKVLARRLARSYRDQD